MQTLSLCTKGLTSLDVQYPGRWSPVKMSRAWAMKMGVPFAYRQIFITGTKVRAVVSLQNATNGKLAGSKKKTRGRETSRVVEVGTTKQATHQNAIHVRAEKSALSSTLNLQQPGHSSTNSRAQDLSYISCVAGAQIYLVPKGSDARVEASVGNAVSKRPRCRC